MPPYDEQTQAFIDGEVSRFEREETLPPISCTCRGPRTRPHLLLQQAWGV